MNKLQQRLYHVLTTLKKLVHQLSYTQRLLFIFFALLLIVGSLGSLIFVSHATTIQVPSRGGSFTEGVVGTPRFINPVLATSGPDKDLVEVVYAGLMTYDGENYIPELARDYTISEDGLTYTFTLKDDLVFHDNKPLTTADIDFTIQLIQNGATKSPLRSQWLDVTTQIIDEKTIQFNLSQAYAGFLAVTTVGIIPRHIFSDITPDHLSFSEYNINAIGSGPFKIKDVAKDSIGIPKEITLIKNNRYALGRPHLKKITMTFFANIEEAHKELDKKNIDGVYNMSPNNMTDFDTRAFSIHHSSLPHVFALFFNQNRQNIFLDTDVREAIDSVIPREAIIKRIFNGYGHALCGPIPPSMIGSIACPDEYQKLTAEQKIVRASNILKDAGWKRNSEGILQKEGQVLEFTIALPNNPELKETAAMIETTLSDLGINIEQQVFEPGNFDQDVIRPRAYEALLFGQIYEHDTDSFAFWHSSGQNDPGFNIGIYANTTTDALLEKAVAEDNVTERTEIYRDLGTTFKNNTPAIFLYTPDALYVTRSHTQGISIQGLITPNHRFSMIHTWYRNTQRIWKPFMDAKKLY
jgi:peptide/nickel transport system substrate-binding protein